MTGLRRWRSTDVLGCEVASRGLDRTFGSASQPHGMRGTPVDEQ